MARPGALGKCPRSDRELWEWVQAHPRWKAGGPKAVLRMYGVSLRFSEECCNISAMPMWQLTVRIPYEGEESRYKRCDIYTAKDTTPMGAAVKLWDYVETRKPNCTNQAPWED